MHTLHHGDCLDVLRTLPDQSVDAVVTDPPYGIEFMGKKWDKPWASRFTGIRDGAPLPDRPLHVNPRCRSCGGYQRGTKNKCACPCPDWASSQAEAVSKIARAFQEWCREWGEEVFRVLKPGAHLLAFGGTRTYHRLTCGLEDAGFEIRDTIQWLHGQGFPKSLNVGGGFGTALKPSHEPIVLARKPLDGTVAGNVTAYGTGALNVDACRVGQMTDAEVRRSGRSTNGSVYGKLDSVDWRASGREPAGRWPANVALTHNADCDGECSPGCAVAELDQQSGERPGFSSQRDMKYNPGSDGIIYGRGMGLVRPGEREGYNDSGGASRFFPTFRYQAKPSTAEKGDGLDDRNPHPTVKPVELMRWLVRLVTPPGGTVLDCFAGSGSTLVAATLEGFDSVGVEAEAEYLPVIEGRVGWAERQAVQDALPGF